MSLCQQTLAGSILLWLSLLSHSLSWPHCLYSSKFSISANPTLGSFTSQHHVWAPVLVVSATATWLSRKAAQPSPNQGECAIRLRGPAPGCFLLLPTWSPSYWLPSWLPWIQGCFPTVHGHPANDLEDVLEKYADSLSLLSQNCPIHYATTLIVSLSASMVPCFPHMKAKLCSGPPKLDQKLALQLGKLVHSQSPTDLELPQSCSCLHS